MTSVLLLLGAALAFLLLRATRRALNSDAPVTETASSAIGPAARASWSEANRDDWEGSFWEVADPMAVSARLHLKYRDGKGSSTRRIVDVRKFGAYGPTTLLIAHCHLRNATRTFRADRIAECSDAETGEVLSDAALFLRDRYLASPEASANRLAADSYDALRVLLYVGKADGQLRAAERERIAAACRSLSGDPRLTGHLIAEMLAQMDVPTLPAFRLAVSRLARRDPWITRTVLEASEAIVATQKSIHHAEAEALEYMRQRFTVPAR